MNRSLYYHWIIPLPLLLIATYLLDVQGFDLRLADAIYAFEGGSWNLHNSWLLETVIHNGGRMLVGALILLNLGALASTWLSHRMRSYRVGLAYLLGAVITSLLIVSSLKGITHISCPWDFQRYGGKQFYTPIINAIFGSGTVRCFPAGHASGGYAWVALYFFCRLYKPQWRMAALSVGLLLGMAFGLSQQFRGAHFLSHDLWTLAICWYTALASYHCCFRHHTVAEYAIRKDQRLNADKV
ncbi:phosphatase PAP2 family protein [Amphritea opalescens]|nr:phosphatase PAP2 family protein [Amphritea opalescens]